MPKARKPSPPPPPGRLAGTIIRELEHCATSGQRPETVFEDWLTLVDATLRQLPAQYQAAAQTGQPAPDPPEVQALWGRLRQRYGRPEYWEHFSRALALLLGGTATYQDYPHGLRESHPLIAVFSTSLCTRWTRRTAGLAGCIR